MSKVTRVKTSAVVSVVLEKSDGDFGFFGTFSSEESVIKNVKKYLKVADVFLADTSDVIEPLLVDVSIWQAIIPLNENETVSVLKKDWDFIEVIVDKLNGDEIEKVENRVWGYVITSSVD